jgi:5-(carboxyamino)imidazole ribonucleotide synthase
MNRKLRIGVLGGGQLGRMLQEVSARWNWEVYCMDKSPDSPAALYYKYFHQGDIMNYEDVLSFGADKDILTVEIEHVNIEALEQLEASGTKVHPNPAALKIIKNKSLQKNYYIANDIPCPIFVEFSNKSEALDKFNALPFSIPCIYKSAEFGYDGKGVRTIRSIEDVHTLPDMPGFFEERIDISREIAISVCANEKGEISFFTPVIMQFDEENHILSEVYSDYDTESTFRSEMEAIGTKIVNGLGICGLLAIEFFISKENKLWVNEVAPRPHNSMHHTIENCYTSQFEQHLRGISNLTLGSTRMIKPAIMYNIIGKEGQATVLYWPEMSKIYNIEGCYLHLYGKTINKPGRKMGHVTLIGDDMPILEHKLEILKKIF